MTNLNENRLRKGLRWFMDKVRGTADPGDVKKGDITKPKEMSKIRSFNLYVTIYSDPKYKDELPFYDAMPLFFPLDIKKGSEGPLLRGINIHYLTPVNRKKFLKELETVLRRVAMMQNYNPDHLDELPHQNVTRIVGRYMEKVYQQGGGSAGAHIRQAYRSYFLHRMKGKLKKIPLSEWAQASDVYLPVFRKASPSEVYVEVKKQFELYKGRSRSPIY